MGFLEDEFAIYTKGYQSGFKYGGYVAMKVILWPKLSSWCKRHGFKGAHRQTEIDLSVCACECGCRAPLKVRTSMFKIPVCETCQMRCAPSKATE